MRMHNPPHPGEFIKEFYLEGAITHRALADALNVAVSTVNRLVNGKSDLTPEMAIRLSVVLGRSPESWLAMQDHYSLWMAQKNIDISSLKNIFPQNTLEIVD